ncbi:MAG: hypothetical protein ACKVJE_21915 [Pseudomonadales bacterium]
MQTEDLDHDAILESGDPDAIAKLLEGLDDDFEFTTDKEDEAGDELAQGEASSADVVEEEAAKDDVSQEAETQEEAGSVPADAQGFVESKNGQHKIPYSVLETQRNRATTAEQELNDLKKQQEKQSRQLEQLTKQLEQNGLDPEALPEDFKLTDELETQLLEDFGTAGKAMIAMYKRAEITAAQISTQQPAQQPAPIASDSPVEAAIAGNNSLNAWRDGYSKGESPELWEYAVQMDTQLQEDPAWSNKSLDERFAEAARRTEGAFGISSQPNTDSQHKIDAAIKKAEQDLSPPTSLSDMGAGATSPDKSLADRLTEMDADDQLAALDKMSAADRDKVLAQIDF